MNKPEIETMAEPLEIDMTEKPVRIGLGTQLREHADVADNCRWPFGELLRQAATEIERLQGIIQSNDPVALIKEIWNHQPVYLFEAIADATTKKTENENYLFTR